MVDTPRARIGAAAWLAICVLAGCAVEWQNAEPANALPEASSPRGSVSAGWRLFQGKCASCHGPAASGTDDAPNLLPRVAQMGPQRFARLVLARYDWSMSASAAAAESGARDALIEQAMRRSASPAAMRAWQDDPQVHAHIADLYAYVAARAEGTQGPDRPAP